MGEEHRRREAQAFHKAVLCQEVDVDGFVSNAGANVVSIGASSLEYTEGEILL